MSEHINIYVKAVIDGTVIATRERAVAEELIEDESNIETFVRMIYDEDITSILNQYGECLFTADCPIIFEVFAEDEFVFGIKYEIALTDSSTIRNDIAKTTELNGGDYDD